MRHATRAAGSDALEAADGVGPRLMTGPGCSGQIWQLVRRPGSDFFRFHAPSRLIVLAWVNDESTRRAYESDSDAYRVFKKMLANGHPPDDWAHLLAEAKAQSQRLNSLAIGKGTDAAPR